MLHREDATVSDQPPDLTQTTEGDRAVQRRVSPQPEPLGDHTSARRIKHRPTVSGELFARAVQRTVGHSGVIGAPSWLRFGSLDALNAAIGERYRGFASAGRRLTPFSDAPPRPFRRVEAGAEWLDP